MSEIVITLKLSDIAELVDMVCEIDESKDLITKRAVSLAVEKLHGKLIDILAENEHLIYAKDE